MKAPLYTLCCVLVVALNITSLAQAQQAPPDAAQAAIRESLAREAAKIELRQRLADAQAAQAKADYYAAARLYDEAVVLAKRAQTGVDLEFRQVLDGMTATRLVLAEQAQRRGEFDQADRHIAIVLNDDPKNEAALAFRAQNAKLHAEMAGRMPSQETIARVPELQRDLANAGTLVHDGKLLFEMGKLDASEAKLQQALAIDPGNTAANKYLNIIREQRHIQANARREEWSKQTLLEVDKAWNAPVKRELLPQPNPYARTNLVHTGPGRQAIYSKLERIRLDNVSYDGLPLSEVVKSLAEEAKRRDPERRGINIIVSGNVDMPAPPPAPIDPATGLPVAGAAAGVAEPIDLATTTIRIVPPLTDITLGQALDAIAKVADRPLKYSIEEYAIVFSPKSVETPTLHTRWFKVDPNTFLQGLAGVVGFDFGVAGGGQGGGGGGGGGRGGGGGGRGGGGGGGGGQGGEQALGAEYIGVRLGRFIGGQGGQGQQQQQQPTQPGQIALNQFGVRNLTLETLTQDYITIIRQFFLAAGVDLAPPKAIFWNDRLGMLMVRGTLQDLDIIEQAVQVMNMAPPQITIEAKFAEVSQEDIKALGFDWFLGNTLISDGRMGLQGGTAPTFSGRPSTANPIGAFPTPGVPIPPQATDGLLTTGLRQIAGGVANRSDIGMPDVMTLSGILTDPQFRLIVRALEQRQGIDLLSAPKVTTLSGRQTQIKTVQVRTIATDVEIEQTGGGGNP